MLKGLQGIGRQIVRILAFVSKEFSTALSQPRLIGVLILGPFLILLLFGVSFRDVARILRAYIVIPEDSELEPTIREFTERSGVVVDVLDITSDLAGAMNALSTKAADIVVVFPGDAVEKFESNQRATLTFYHQAIDPFEAAYVQIVARQITEETNRQLQYAAIEESKANAQLYQAEVREMIADPGSAGGTDATSSETASAVSAGGMWLLFRTVGDAAGDSTEQEPEAGNPAGELEAVDAQLTEFLEINPAIIVEPFLQETKPLNVTDIQPAHFYFPVALALLLQHLAISLGSLTIVSERLTGTTELMRAAPVNPIEAMIGKYLGFLALVGIVAAALTALGVYVLKVPLTGSLGLYALVIFLVLVVSLGIGFLISGFVQTESQAIQITMILLLASIFFSGLFIPLYKLWWPAQTISWSLPATYGVIMLQDTMLRGIPPESGLFLVLAAAGVVLFFFSWLRLRRLMVQA